MHEQPREQPACVWQPVARSELTPLKASSERACLPGRAQVIAELDEKKREALEKTWRKVDADFGSIFATLLPGTSAKLEPPEGASFLAGAAVM